MARPLLLGSIGAYWVSAIGGEPPDQVGLATKLGEILALAIVLRPAPSRRWRKLRSIAGSVAIGLLVVLTATSSWVGAFRASAAEPGAVAGHHVHGGSVAPPGTILPVVPQRDPTPAERAAAADLVQAARVALARYADPAVAAADGYRVKGLAGIDFHAANPANENDDRVLDPAHPETLVYAVAPDGRPVLMGAMFLMPKIGTPGPTIGGPLTVWHAHQHVCFSLTPPALAGLLSPLGMCPLGTIDVPLTAEMIHIWIVPGAPEPFGDLDEAWKRAYLEALVATPVAAHATSVPSMTRPRRDATKPSLDDDVQSALKWLKSHSTKATRDGMARYAIPSDNALGVAMKDIKALGTKLGRNQELAVALWDTGVYEARMLCSFVGDPATAHVRPDGPLVQGLRQLGHLRHDVLQPVRPNAARVGEGRAVEHEAQRVREAHGLRVALESCAA